MNSLWRHTWHVGTYFGRPMYGKRRPLAKLWYQLHIRYVAGGFIFKFTGGGIITPLGKTCYKKRLGRTRVNTPSGTSQLWPLGALTCPRYKGMCHFDDLFWSSSAAPETHLFTPSVSSYALRFPFFEKFDIFRPISLQFSAPHTKKIIPETLVFKEKNQFCRPCFWKLVRHIPKKKKKN